MITWTGTRKKLSKKYLGESHAYYYQCNRKNTKKYSSVCSTLPAPAEPLENYIVNFVIDLLKNPQAVFKHQKDLPSTRKRIRQLKNDRKRLNSLINALPQRRKRLKEQQEIGAIPTSELKDRLAELTSKEKQYKKDIEELDLQISQQAISEGYIKSFEVFRDKYAQVIDDVNSDRKQLYEMLHVFIDEVIISSRPVDPEIDVVAGRKKKDQVIPYKLEIKLRLPQYLLQQLVRDQVQFEDKNPHL